MCGGAAEGHKGPGAYEIGIEELELSVRTFNSLKRTGITSVGELLDMLDKGDDAMLCIRNFGPGSLREVKAATEDLKVERLRSPEAWCGTPFLMTEGEIKEKQQKMLSLTEDLRSAINQGLHGIPVMQILNRLAVLDKQLGESAND